MISMRLHSLRTLYRTPTAAARSAKAVKTTKATPHPVHVPQQRPVSQAPRSRPRYFENEDEDEKLVSFLMDSRIEHMLEATPFTFQSDASS